MPHIGWNEVDALPKCPLFKGLKPKSYFYFVHSFYAQPSSRAIIAGKTNYAKPFCSAIWKGKVFATQFHPEKSQRDGLRLIRNFLAVKP